MINRVILTGRLTDVPQVRMGPQSKVCSFSLAVNRRFKTPGQPEADFIRCVAFGKTAELIEQYITKGSLIGIEGRIQTGSYEDRQTGKRIYTTDVVCDVVEFLEPRRSQNDYNQQNYGGYQPQQNSYYNPNPETAPVSNNSYPSYEQESDSGYDENSVDIATEDLPF